MLIIVLGFQFLLFGSNFFLCVLISVAGESFVVVGLLIVVVVVGGSDGSGYSTK